jgi:DNA helicase II / ATP-dependent DNA helicase PcrA
VTRDYYVQPSNPVASSQIDYARQLNPQQLAAVTAPAGPSLVIAGAGSGKTRTLVYRVAYLLEQGVPADRLLLLTFTNKAAHEMMRRVTELLGYNLSSLWGGTFHSVGNRVLRRHVERVGYQNGFTILDREDALKLLKTCVQDSGLNPKKSIFPKPEVLAEIFSLAANTCQPLEAAVEQKNPELDPILPALLQLREAYIKRKQAANVMDFDDLLSQWLKLLHDHQEVRDYYQQRFEHILVDEYQDTNTLQCRLIDVLAGRRHQVMAVGDDAQSIYSWRGANFRNILRFAEHYHGAAIYKIETNYRSTPEILAVANDAIRANIHQHAKQLTPSRPSQSKPALVACMDANNQAQFVAQRVAELHDEGRSLDRVVVLYRSHFHALELQVALTAHNIPFLITSGIRFFEQAHIKDVTAILKLLVNPQDETAFRRMVELLPKIGARGSDRLWLMFSQVLQTATPPRAALAQALAACQPLMPAQTTTAWINLVETLLQMAAEPLSKEPAKMIRLILEAFYQDYLKASYPNARARLEDLEQLAIYAENYDDLEILLSQLALLSSADTEGESQENQDTPRLRLSTVHQAKGLEFDVVFVIMLCDGLFPSNWSLNDPEKEEEERRLFYVAITRARDELYLCYPLIRVQGSQHFGLQQRRSRFLDEISPDLLDAWSLHSPF